MSVDKRKHSALSSLSDLDTSANTTTHASSPEQNTGKSTKNKKKTKKAKVEKRNTEDENKETKLVTADKMAAKYSIEEELRKINEKLSQVIKKEDKGFLRQLVKEVFNEMKETLLSSFTRQIEIIEGDLHDKTIENEKLKSEIQGMKKELEEKSDEIKRMEKRNDHDKQKYNESLNEHEQYSRKNIIRISNLPKDDQKQTSEETTTQVIKFIKDKLGLALSATDIDISHRLGKFRNAGRPRQVIVKFVRRQTKIDVMTRRKNLKGTKIYVFEDLTKLNSEVLACTRKKQTDEIERSWSVDGKIYIKWKSNSSIEKVQFADYQKWIDLPWP